MFIEPPSSDAALRSALYAGKVVHGPATLGSLTLADRVWRWVKDAFEDNPRYAPNNLDPNDIFQRIGHLRRQIFEADAVRADLAQLLRDFDLDPAQYRFDPPKLRVVLSDGHKNPRAAPLYAAHRDTWYGHPQSLITWWIPLHDASEKETFEFFPDAMNVAVKNDSHAFNSAEWSQDLRIGWQDPDAGLRETYPSLCLDALQTRLQRREGFACRRGDNLLFTGAHLHRTRPQSLGRARYSLDFRLAHVDDTSAGRGALNVDDLSGLGAFSTYFAFPAI
ncbi:MAG: hypothetical protein AAF449_15650 [Myxococcota bacterium]